MSSCWIVVARCYDYAQHVEYEWRWISRNTNPVHDLERAAHAARLHVHDTDAEQVEHAPCEHCGRVYHVDQLYLDDVNSEARHELLCVSCARADGLSDEEIADYCPAYGAVRRAERIADEQSERGIYDGPMWVGEGA